MASRVKLRLHAKVGLSGDGHKILVFRSPEYVAEQLKTYNEGKDVVVIVETVAPNRSGQQNRYWWGVCYPLLAEMTGYTENEIHEWCKSSYLKPKILTVKGKSYYVSPSTTELSVSDGVEYTDKLRNLGVELGGYIPTPEDSGYISNTGDKKWRTSPKS